MVGAASRTSDEPSRSDLGVTSPLGLPAAAHDGNRWYGEFIPTALKFLGTRSRSPWRFCVHDLQTLQDIWTAVYGKTLPWKIELNDCVYASVSLNIWPTRAKVAHLTSQTMDAVQKWRDCISNAALCALEHFFQSSRAFVDFAARVRFCQAVLRDSRLFYEGFDTPYRRASLNMFERNRI